MARRRARRRSIRGEQREEAMRQVKEFPRRMEPILPGRPQGSVNLPWDVARIATRGADRPAVGGWDGGFACARGVGRGIRRGSGTSGTAETRSVCGWYIAGKGRSGSGSVGRRPRGARSTRRRSASGGSEHRARARRVATAIPWRPRRLRWRARGHAAKPHFQTGCATGLAVTSPRGTLVDRRRRIAATPAARPCGG
jgi:hypothetical protein